MSTLGKRIVTAAVLIVAVLIVLFGQRPPAAAWFFSACLLMGCWEWSGFFASAAWLRIVYLLLGMVLAAGLLLALPANQPPLALLAAAACWWLLVTAGLYTREVRYPPVLVAVAGYLALLPAWAALLWILGEPQGAWRLVWMIAVVAAADTGAYFTGKAIGRRKLAPRLSPGKTIEGMAGGLLAATAVAVGGAWMLGEPLWHFALAGPLIAAISVVGDLTVSAAKRNAGLKDSGWILPGHGGIMDRSDSLVAAAPFFALALSL